MTKPKLYRKRHDPWPAEWAIVNRKDGRLMAGHEDRRLHIYATRAEARDQMWKGSLLRRYGTVIKILISEIPAKSKGRK